MRQFFTSRKRPRAGAIARRAESVQLDLVAVGLAIWLVLLVMARFAALMPPVAQIQVLDQSSLMTGGF